MKHKDIVKIIADILKQFDSEYPKHKNFQEGVGPFGEPQLVKEIVKRLGNRGLPAETKQTPDMILCDTWAFEFKIVRPFGDNGNEAENWSQNLLHPYVGNVSLIGDAYKLLNLNEFEHKCLFAIGYEHDDPIISLDPLLSSFELIAKCVMSIPLGQRVEEVRKELVHPEHKVLRCVSWELIWPFMNNSIFEN